MSARDARDEKDGERKLNPGDRFGTYTVVKLLDDGPLPINDAIRIVYQIASVLELAREKGIVHRDIKPANIMFGGGRGARLAHVRDEDLTRAVQKALNALFPGWKTSEIGNSGSPGCWRQRDGEEDVVCTHPPREDVPVVISRRLTLPRNDPKLHVSVIGGDDFELQVKVNGKVIQRPDVNGRAWTDLTVDLSKWAGRNVLLVVLNMPTGWQHEEAHWQRIEVK